MCPEWTVIKLVGPPGFEPGTSCSPSKTALAGRPYPLDHQTLPSEALESAATPEPRQWTPWTPVISCQRDL
jgi:hypothetical protein